MKVLTPVPAIVVFLQRARRLLVIQSFVASIHWCMIYLIISIGLGLIFDFNMVHFEDWHWNFTVTAMIGFLLLILLQGVRAWLPFRSLQQVAQIIDARSTTGGDGLQAAYSLMTDGLVDGTNEWMAKRAVFTQAHWCVDTSLANILTWHPILRTQLRWLLLFICLFGTLLVVPQTRLSLLHIVMQVEGQGPQDLVVQLSIDSEQRLLLGNDVVIHASSATNLGIAQLHIVYQNGEQRILSTQPLEQRGQRTFYRWELIDVQQSLRCYVSVVGGRSKTIPIEVYQSPRLLSQQWIITPPQYSGLEQQVSDRFELAALPGSQALWQGRIHQAGISSAQWVQLGGESWPVRVEAQSLETSLSVTFPIRQGGRYALDLVQADGHIIRLPQRWRIRLLQDQVPRLHIDLEHESFLSHSTIVVDIQAGDDVALETAYCELKGPNGQLHRWEMPSDEMPQDEWHEVVQFSLREWFVIPGDTIELHSLVRDSGGQEVILPVRKITIQSEDELRHSQGLQLRQQIGHDLKSAWRKINSLEREWEQMRRLSRIHGSTSFRGELLRSEQHWRQLQAFMKSLRQSASALLEVQSISAAVDHDVLHQWDYLNTYTLTNLLYCLDEMIDKEGRYLEELFKSAFFLSNNVI